MDLSQIHLLGQLGIFCPSNPADYGTVIARLKQLRVFHHPDKWIRGPPADATKSQISSHGKMSTLLNMHYDKLRDALCACMKEATERKHVPTSTGSTPQPRTSSTGHASSHTPKTAAEPSVFYSTRGSSQRVGVEQTDYFAAFFGSKFKEDKPAKYSVPKFFQSSARKADPPPKPAPTPTEKKCTCMYCKQTVCNKMTEFDLEFIEPVDSTCAHFVHTKRISGTCANPDILKKMRLENFETVRKFLEVSELGWREIVPIPGIGVPHLRNPSLKILEDMTITT